MCIDLAGLLRLRKRERECKSKSKAYTTSITNLYDSFYILQCLHSLLLHTRSLSSSLTTHLIHYLIHKPRSPGSQKILTINLALNLLLSESTSGTAFNAAIINVPKNYTSSISTPDSFKYPYPSKFKTPLSSLQIPASTIQLIKIHVHLHELIPNTHPHSAMLLRINRQFHRSPLQE